MGLTAEQIREGKEFGKVWNTLSRGEKRSISSRYHTTDEELVNEGEAESGLKKLSAAGYEPESLSRLLEFLIDPNCWS